MISADTAQALSTCPIQPQAVRVSHFDDRRPITTAIRIWPAPAAWAHGLASDGRWFSVPLAAAGAVLADPEEPRADSGLLDGWSADVRALLAAIPGEVREAIRPLPRVFAWKVLVLLGHAPESLDLVHQHPVLAGLIAFRARDAYDGDEPYHQVRERIGGAPESLLGLLRLPEDPRLVALLDDMQPEVLRELGDDGIVELLRASTATDP